MDKVEKIRELRKFFENVEEDKRALAYDTIDEYVYAIYKMKELREFPFLRVDKRNPAKQEQTIASKLYKDFSQSADNKRKILLMILYRVESSAVNDLLEKLSCFEIR